MDGIMKTRGKEMIMDSKEWLSRVSKAIDKLGEELMEVEWTQAEIANQELGVHLDALRTHLDNAKGRCSTAYQMALRVRMDVSAAELAALKKYIADHGRRWRSDLRQEWMTESGASSTLRELRNRVGPSGLDKIKP